MESPQYNKERSFSLDDAKVDYVSILGLEDRRRRFSEDIADLEIKDSVRIKKLLRQLQRDAHLHLQSKNNYLEILLRLRLVSIPSM